MYDYPSQYVSGSGLLTIKPLHFRNIDLTVAGAIQFLKPHNGKTFIPTKITMVNNTVSGTISVAPSIKIDNGSVDVVSAFEPDQDAASVQLLDLDGQQITYANPLELTVLTPASGTTPVFTADFIVEGYLY